MKYKFFGLILASALALTACKTAKTEVLSNASIKKVINDPNIVFVDVRTPEQFANGSIENAINIPLAEIQKDPTSLKGKKVVVFCNKGIQADEAVKILKKNGVEVYDGTSIKNIKAIQESTL
jgi:phage shock protein E